MYIRDDIKMDDYKKQPYSIVPTTIECVPNGGGDWLVTAKCMVYNGVCWDGYWLGVGLDYFCVYSRKPFTDDYDETVDDVAQFNLFESYVTNDNGDGYDFDVWTKPGNVMVQLYEVCKMSKGLM